MSVASFPLDTRTDPTRAAAPGGLGAWFRAWHLLSLDAPSVAALWAWFLARSLRLDLTTAWEPLLLALATWLVYVADRILDGLASGGDGTRPAAAGAASGGRAARLRERHWFHLRYRGRLLAAWTLAAAVLLWAAPALLPAPVLRAYFGLGLIALLYLALVHAPWPGAGPWLPKEAAVAVVFALAVAVPAWDAAGRLPAPLAIAVILFAAVCWLNCVAIERWEAAAAAPPAGTHPSTRWAGAHLRPLALALALAAAAALPASAAAAVLTAAAAFWALDTLRNRLTPLQLRIAADLALLTPLLWLRW